MFKQQDLDFFKNFGYQHIGQVVGKTQIMMDNIRSGRLKPLLTSLKAETENIAGYYPTDQIVIAARTGAGKTAKVISEMSDFANSNVNPYYADDNFIILYDSYEIADWRNILRMISREAGIEAKALLDYQQKLLEEKFTALKTIAEKFKSMPVFITSIPKTVEQWVESKKQIQGKYPRCYIMNVVDHTRLVRKKDEGKEEEKITSLMIGGIDLKNNFNMINIYLSQMNRNIETSVQRDKLGMHLPVSSDIFGSDAVFQCADVVKALHRPGAYGLVEFEGIPTGIDLRDPKKSDDLMLEVILKQREGWTGVIKLKHNLAYNQFFDFPELPAIDRNLIDF